MTEPRTFTISIPPKLAREVDKVAKAEGRTRSELFREAMRQYVERRTRWASIFALGTKIAKEKGLSEEKVARIVKEGRRTRAR